MSGRDAAAPTLDLRGLRCPLPALKTMRALRRAGPGALLDVLADDPLAGLDIPNAAREQGGSLVARCREGEVWRFLLRACGDGTDPPDPPDPPAAPA